MARTKYLNLNMRANKLATIETANGICAEYAEQGLVLTLRQLYYQFVARGLIANKQTEYDRIGEACNDGRMAGLMDWDYLIDRTRNLASYKTFKGPEDAITQMADKYHRDMWKPQKKRVEVWIEKDAAIGVIEGVCATNSVPYFSTRGYTSVSEMHQAAQRIRWHIEQGEQVTILHIGDHDPSGLDMSRDIEDRLRTFLTVDWRGLHDPLVITRGQIKASMRREMREHDSLIKDDEDPFTFKRIALSIEQVRQYNPPPNPVKKTDGRWVKYNEQTGEEHSWELDALEPSVLVSLIQDEVDRLKDEDIWMESDAEMEQERQMLKTLGAYWPQTKSFAERLVAGGKSK